MISTPNFYLITYSICLVKAQFLVLLQPKFTKHASNQLHSFSMLDFTITNRYSQLKALNFQHQLPLNGHSTNPNHLLVVSYQLLVIQLLKLFFEAKYNNKKKYFNLHHYWLLQVFTFSLKPSPDHFIFYLLISLIFQFLNLLYSVIFTNLVSLIQRVLILIFDYLVMQLSSSNYRSLTICLHSVVKDFLIKFKEHQLLPNALLVARN